MHLTDDQSQRADCVQAHVDWVVRLDGPLDQVVSHRSGEGEDEVHVVHPK